MKKRLQLLVFIAMISAILFLTQGYWEHWLIGTLSIIFTLSVIFIGIVISLENRHPTTTLTWLVILSVFPVFGFFFYILFGRNVRKKRLYQKKAYLDDQAFNKIEPNKNVPPELEQHIGDHQRMFIHLAKHLGKSPISYHSNTKVLTNGDATFNAILSELKKANHHIHLEYYIVRDDEIGQEIKEVLVNKAKIGVEVRFLYDAVGSWKLSSKYIDDLRDAGVEMVPFSPVRIPILNNKINFRNHRKIVVIDGATAFVGGLNIGDEYLGRDKYFGLWRDTHLEVKGEAVKSLQTIFLQDWYYMTGQPLLTPSYLSPHKNQINGSGGVQCIAGGPDTEWEVLKHLFFSMITSAKKSIWIASPYFIPDEDILTALKVACLSGIDVRILVPDRPDKRIVFYASRSYFPELLEAGAKIYEYKKGFLHSKVVIVDGELASIGTANMDMRSFHLNFEVNAFLYKTESTQTLVDDFSADLTHSNALQLATFKKRPFFLRLVESTARLLSPLL